MRASFAWIILLPTIRKYNRNKINKYYVKKIRNLLFLGLGLIGLKVTLILR